MDGFNRLKVTKAFFYGGFLLFTVSVVLLLTIVNLRDVGEFEDTSASVAPLAQDPAAGAVYKEVKLKWPDGNRAWRVNNPLCTNDKCADDPNDPDDPYLVPNHILQFVNLSYASEPYSENAITAEDLGADNTRNEFIIDRWGGHDGNQNEKFNLNVALTDQQNDLPASFEYVVPDIETLPDPRSNMYYHHDNPLIEINKADLRPGDNTLEGYVGNGSSGGFWQWGWTSAILRMYFQPQSRPHATAEVDVANSVGENPIIKLKNITLPSGQTIEKVEYVAYYRGVDEDGDGYYTDWHEGYFSPKKDQVAGSFEVSGHVGTSTTGPNFEVTWNTRYVPDQSSGAIKFVARVKTSNDIWYITPIKTGVSLARSNSSVKMYTASNVPEKYSSRNNQISDAVRVRIPSSDSSVVNSATESAMFWRTWNGLNYEWGYNSHSSTFQGLNHAFHQGFYNIPVNKLVAGNGVDDGKVWIKAHTEEHAVEGSWPGPTLLIRTGVLSASDTPTPILSPTPTLEVTNTPEGTPYVTPSLTPTPLGSIPPSITPSITPSMTPTGIPGSSPTLTSTPILSVTPSATIIPSNTLVPTIGSSPTPTQITGAIACGKADVDNNEKFGITDFVAFAVAYQKTCNDSSQSFGLCGGKDADRNGTVSINDFVSFASRYTPVASCELEYNENYNY